MAPGARAIRRNACKRGHDRDVWGYDTGPRIICRLCRVVYLREYARLRRAGVRPIKVDLDAIFKNKMHLKSLGALNLKPEDIRDNGRFGARYSKRAAA